MNSSLVGTIRKLYDVPRNTWVMVQNDEKGPPGTRGFVATEVLKFHHLDGMYSYCTDQYGAVHHLPAWAEVMICDKPF